MSKYSRGRGFKVSNEMFFKLEIIRVFIVKLKTNMFKLSC